jgi:DNA-binding CsgD family transcriptional regulator
MVPYIEQQQKNPDPLPDQQIYIVGQRRLQNELLSGYLEKETGIQCRMLDTLCQVPCDGKTCDRPQRQILWDCTGRDLDRLLVDIEEDGGTLLADELVALFNVSPGLGIEEKTVTLGIRGFFYEHDPLELFLKGVRAIFNGELWLSREIMTRCILEKGPTGPAAGGSANGGAGDRSLLTHREVEILTMIAVGSTNEEIADQLCISPHTVKTHIYNIFRKIEVPNRLQAALWAAKNL